MAAVSTGDTTTGEATAVSARPLITDLADAPLDVPVALRREADGLLHPDATAITDRPTRTEVSDQVTAHALDPSPHPAYDDIPDLRLWFDNAII